MAAKATKTTNRLHFTDLDATRFEDLCLAIVFPLHPWIDIQHYGRVGGDGGVDIYARERVEDGATRDWFVQCRRYKSATKRTLTKAVDDTLAKVENAPQVLLIVLACDVRRSAHEAYQKYASEKGVSIPLLWTASTLEARLHAERRDLLFSYFGISEASQARYRESTISRNIELKKRLRKELLKPPKEVNWDKARSHPPDKFDISEAIIRSIDDTTYPNVDDKSSGISGWFKLEVWDFYHNGLEFIVGVPSGIVDEHGHWTVIEYDQSYDEKKYQKIKMLKLARIPFRNIVNVDTIGDEYYPEPHLYCRFADGGSPYEGFRYVRIDGDYPRAMKPELQFQYKER